MKKFLNLIIFIITMLFSASSALAYDDCWDATYAVGGYNLYSFGVDMYNTNEYCAPVEPVCCDSCYDTPTLYNTYNNPYTEQLQQMVYTNQQLINQIYGNNPMPMPIPGISDPGFGNNPYTNPTLGNIPPFYPTNPLTPYYPSYPTTPIAPYYPSYPITPIAPNYPSNPSYPPVTSLPRPPSLPPYAGCDNITVLCPVTVGNNPTTPGNPPVVNLPQNPNLAPSYQTNTNPVGQGPTRYRVPRGMRNLSH